MDKDVVQFRFLYDNERYADLIFDFIRMSEDKKGLRKLVEEDAAFQNMDESAYDMAMAYTDARELISVKKYHRKDGKVDMCKALTEMLQDEREEGISGLIRDNLDQGKSREEILEKLCRYYGMSRDKAEKYIESYHI